MGLFQNLEDAAISAIAKPIIKGVVIGWVNNVDPTTHQPRPLIAASDAPEIEDALYKMLGVVFGEIAQAAEAKGS